MGCSNCGCGSKTNGGLPAGCKNNGGCSSGGCNRMNVFDWLSTIPLPNNQTYDFVEVSFNKGSRKEFFKNTQRLNLFTNDWVVVEGVSGIDIGTISARGEIARLQVKKYQVKEEDITKRVIRSATDDDLQMYYNNKANEPAYLVRSRAIAKELNLDMKVCEVELQADAKKATFFYTADGRIDFRELIRVYATEFKLKVEMRQIGSRQESAKVGGVGSCGRELCCSTWLTDFKSVNTTAARYQNLSINQSKLSGQCGRLKCCLNYELDTYLDALKGFPEQADELKTKSGVAYLQKRDIFRNYMWYSFKESNKQYPLAIERVNEILALNKKGELADELGFVELETTVTKEERKPKTVDFGFVNDVGQLTLKSLENKKKKKSSSNPNAKQNLQTKSARPTDSKDGNRNTPKNQQSNARPVANEGAKGNPQKGSQRAHNNPSVQQKDGKPHQPSYRPKQGGGHQNRPKRTPGQNNKRPDSPPKPTE